MAWAEADNKQVAHTSNENHTQTYAVSLDSSSKRRKSFPNSALTTFPVREKRTLGLYRNYIIKIYLSRMIANFVVSCFPLFVFKTQNKVLHGLEHFAHTSILAGCYSFTHRLSIRVIPVLARHSARKNRVHFLEGMKRKTIASEQYGNELLKIP